MSWHGNCYRKRNRDKFPVAKLDEDELGDDDPDDKDRFHHARNGDNFMCPFQCDLCHFRNIHLRDPESGNSKDMNLLVAIRRANLDAFWARAPQTVTKNTGTVKRMVKIGWDSFGIDSYLPPMGPHPLQDEWGMGIAAIILVRSMDKGRYKDTLQFNSTRRTRSAFSNLWGASVHTMTMGVMARDTTKLYVTNCPSYSLWFERFMSGMHSRMGDEVHQDAAITKLLMHAIMDQVENDYLEAIGEPVKKVIARAGLFFMSAFLGSLRGEEVPRIVRQYFIDLNNESMNKSISPHVILPLYGRFKTEGNVPRCYLLRVVCVTDSGLDMGKWVRRVMFHEEASSHVYLFSTEKGKKEKGGTYEGYLFQKLKAIQRDGTGLVPRSIDVEENYGIKRSFRRGSTTEARNAPNSKCNEQDIIRNNRWRSENRAGTKQANLSMIQLYTDTLNSTDADLKFSKCL